MGRKYKFHNKEGLYFVSFATVYWIDVFTRELYFELVVEGMDFCRKNKGMEIYAWCIMPNHIHLVFRAKDNNPGDLMRDFKTYTSKKIQKLIAENIQESRKEWMLWLMKRAGTKNSLILSSSYCVLVGRPAMECKQKMRASRTI
ncbi:MAG: transposase [Fulvivirga sp.]